MDELLDIVATIAIIFSEENFALYCKFVKIRLFHKFDITQILTSENVIQGAFFHRTVIQLSGYDIQ